MTYVLADDDTRFLAAVVAFQQLPIEDVPQVGGRGITWRSKDEAIFKHTGVCFEWWAGKSLAHQSFLTYRGLTFSTTRDHNSDSGVVNR